MKKAIVKKFNLSRIGHGAELSHTSQKNFLKSIFHKKYKIISSSRPQKSCINFIYEGWGNEKEVEEFLSKKNYKYGIIFTESYNRVVSLPPEFSTINNFLYSKSKNSLLKKTYFFFLHFQAKLLFFIEAIVNKINLIQSKRKIQTKIYLRFSDKIFYYSLSLIKKPLIFILVLTIYKKKISSKIYDNFFTIYPMFKIIFLKTFKKINKFDYYINLGNVENIKYLINKKKYFYYNLPFILTSQDNLKLKNINIKNINLQKNTDIKIFDLIFFGRITENRKLLFHKIQKQTSLKLHIVSDFVDEKKLNKLISSSKFILNLPQYNKQDFVSSAKIFEGIRCKFPVPNLVLWDSKTKLFPHYLKQIIFTFSSMEIVNLNKFIDNYDKNYINFLQKLDKFRRFSKKIENNFLQKFRNYKSN